MPVKFVDRHKVGWMPIVEASEGYLLGGRKVCDGPVFERFFDALKVMNAWIEQNLACSRKVKLGRSYSSRGWCLVRCMCQTASDNHA